MPADTRQSPASTPLTRRRRPNIQRVNNRLVQAAHAPVDIASIVYFRLIFGAIMLWEVYRYWDAGWIGRYWIEPAYNFSYAGFEWVQPWPGIGMYIHFAVMGALAICIIFGLWYRVAAALFFLAFTYMFLLEKANYLNHFYFVILVSFLMVFVPAHRAFSVDAHVIPKLRSNTAPAWALWLLRAQVGIVYFYGGLAKINWDWLRGEPMRMWLSRRMDFPLVGQWFTDEWMVYAFSYGGMLFDLLIVPALLWRRTRLVAFCVAVVFHLTNVQLFSIGIFPWFTLAATLLFFPPDWPRRAVALFQQVEPFSVQRRHHHRSKQAPTSATPVHSSLTSKPYRGLTVALVIVYLAVQMIVPLRHHLYPGNVAWTEEGHRFSWRMKLRTKSGVVQFYATNNATGTTWEINPHRYLTPRQVTKLATHPDMIMQFSHYLAEQLPREGYGYVEVRAESWVSLNGREPQLLIDPAADLTAERHRLLPQTWILPLASQFRSSATLQEDLAAADVEIEQ